MRLWILCTIGIAICIPTDFAMADGITITGAITQSTSDGTGPAVNNASLNNIADGDTYKITLHFTGAVSTTGTFNLAGGTLVLSDPTAPASESSFDTISLTVAADGTSDDISLLACLTTGSGCLVGNSLSMNFAIPAADLNSPSAPAMMIPLLTPLDLLEDDGTTDIQGGVATYSYASSTVPEPASLALLSCGLLALAITRVTQHRKSSLS